MSDRSCEFCGESAPYVQDDGMPICGNCSEPVDVLTEARELLDGITPGPWCSEPRNIEPWALTTVYNVFHNGDTPDRDLVAEVAYDNAPFIAAAPDLVRRLADEVERLRAEVRSLEDQEVGAAICCYENEAAIERVRALLPDYVEHCYMTPHAATMLFRTLDGG